MRDDKKNNKTLNSTINHDRKRRINSNKIYAHNYSLKFPLHPDCLIPFNSKLKEIPLKFNSQFIKDTGAAFIRQTTRNLIVTPRFESLEALPGNSQELAAKMRAKALSIAKGLVSRNPGLRLLRPGQPTTQEYAVKDSFAERLPFRFKNDVGKFDKSERVEADGHRVTGAEIEYFSPEHADLYLKMPILFSETTKVFTENLAGYAAQIKLHLATLQDMRDSLKDISKIAGLVKPRARKMPTTFKKSATVKGVS